MHIRDLDGKEVCVLGYGREGQATLRALQQQAPRARITVADVSPDGEIPQGVQRQVGPGYLRGLERFDVIVKSPGIPPEREFSRVQDRLTSATQIFFDSIAGSSARVIGVTGTKGKSTTATLIAEVLRAAGKRVLLVGNIGNPALDVIGEVTDETNFVMELSSYQLMDLTVSPPVAVVTSFFPEHLDYHGSVEAYLEAKKHITRFQRPSDVVFYNARWDGARAIAEESPGEKVLFTDADAPVTLTEVKLLGKHNLSNIAAAWKVAEHLRVPKEAALRVFREFPGLPHRLQFLGEHAGITWVDDSISTTPESTIAALDALGDHVETIILGGQDRGYDFRALAERIVRSGVQNVILFPESGGRIREALVASGFSGALLETRSMPEAVAWAKQHSAAGSVCLLSPASPSYGLFKNFEDRGDQFRTAVEKRSSSLSPSASNFRS